MNTDQVRRQLPVIVPVSAVLAVCALHLQVRYGEKSDGLVTCRDAEVPGSLVVKPGRKLDHAWITLHGERIQGNPTVAICVKLLCLMENWTIRVDVNLQLPVKGGHLWLFCLIKLYGGNSVQDIYAAWIPVA
ncbi:OLC1v1011005C1 [Oldenlandia corymbosa var. corymbosa]|uniref:OLC1v1011005C1 n=1 Tax=Oldenlandia corymbosa var. corymbosa TaxID=529605 RepID=A0AAV1DVF7_OLDCO|nr:OLC1v1011005C1 [Oldenlandia corymbosa var. corymbosa]